MADTENDEIILLEHAALERAQTDVSEEHTPAEASPARRSARVPVAFRLWLRREQRGGTWEEETETQLVSRYGAGLECRHRIEPGAQLALTRRDTGQRATARVAYSRYNEHGCREIGLELVGCDNFWDLDWEALARDADPVPADSTVSAPGEAAADVTSDAAPDVAAGFSPPRSVAAAEDGALKGAATHAVASASTLRGKRRVSKNAFAEKLIAQQHRLYAALAQSDAHALAEMVAPEALWITSTGVEAGAPDAAALLGFDTGAMHETLSVLKLNRGTAVVTGSLTALPDEPGHETAGASDPIAAYCASVWTQRGRRWLLVLHQITRAV